VFGETPEEPIHGPAMKGLLDRLRLAIDRANLGVPRSWPMGRRATAALRKIGAGGRVSLENPSTVRRAVVFLENHRNA